MSDELVDVGYRDPWDERDDIRDDPPTREEYEPDTGPSIVELGSEQRAAAPPDLPRRRLRRETTPTRTADARPALTQTGGHVTSRGEPSGMSNGDSSAGTNGASPAPVIPPAPVRVRAC